MTSSDLPKRLFPSAGEDASVAMRRIETEQTKSASYKLAFTDQEFLVREELRPVRLQLELLKPELILSEQGIQSTVVVFGSARIPEQQVADEQLRIAEENLEKSAQDKNLIKAVKLAKRAQQNAKYYSEACRFASLITQEFETDGNCELVVATGGGPGIMEAANRGASDTGGRSIGLNIVLPFEQCPNPYITPELSFQFHYFAIRKMHFLMRAKALVACPGGFGTMDELFEALTLVQTKKIKPMPILLMGREYWQRVIDFELLVEEGMISEEDLSIFSFVETAEEAVAKIKSFYSGASGESD